MTLEQIESAPSGKVIIKSLFKNTRCTIQPMKDRNGYSIGITELSDIQKQSLQRWEYALPTDTFVLEDNKEIDLKDPKQKVVWNWVKNCTNDLAYSFDEAQKTRKVSFYIYVPEENAKININHTKKKHRAEKHVLETSHSDLIKRAKILGTNMEGLSMELVVQWFLDMLTQGHVAVDRVIDLFESSINGYKILINDAVDKNLMTRDERSGIYYYGTVILGTTFEQVIAWLEEKKNKPVLDKLRESLYPEFFEAK